MESKSLVFLTDTSTRQLLAETELRSTPKGLLLEMDSQGYVTLHNPVLMGEAVDRSGSRVSIGMRPLFQTLAFPTIKVKVSGYAVVEGDNERDLRNTYEETLKAHRAALSGIELATPGNNPFSR